MSQKHGTKKDTQGERPRTHTRWDSFQPQNRTTIKRNNCFRIKTYEILFNK